MQNFKRNVILLSFCQALFMSATSLIFASSALIGYDLLADDKSLATLPIALQFIGNMFTTIPASLLMGKVGRRWGFIIGSGIGIVGASLGVLAILDRSFLLFSFASALLGSFTAFAAYYRFAAVDTAPTNYKSKAISYVLAGGVIAAFIGPNLANWSKNWITDATFAGSIACVIILMLISIILQSGLRIPTPKVDPLSTAGRPLLKIMSQPKFLVAMICGTLGYACMTFIMTATPLAMHAYAHSFPSTAFVIQWHVFAMFAPSFFTGYLINRFGAPAIMLTGALLDLACIAVNFSGTSVIHFWTGLFLLGLGWNFLFVAATSLLTETYSDAERAKTQACNDFILFASVAAASLSAGSIQHATDWQTVNLAALPIVLTIIVTLLIQFTTSKNNNISVNVNTP